jgi:hypothetical protein
MAREAFPHDFSLGIQARTLFYFFSSIISRCFSYVINDRFLKASVTAQKRKLLLHYNSLLSSGAVVVLNRKHYPYRKTIRENTRTNYEEFFFPS